MLNENKTTLARFELARAMLNGLAIHPLNPSGTVSQKNGGSRV